MKICKTSIEKVLRSNQIEYSKNKPKMQAIVEMIDHLTREEQSLVKCVAKAINTTKVCADMNDALLWARLLPFFIYQGGNHIAVHAQSGDPRRIMLVTNS
jgi:hypothetical protein